MKALKRTDPIPGRIAVLGLALIALCLIMAVAAT